ncbi:MAG TPA: S8 family serine peptidase [Steroidobacteraceae bacterium]|nr:S8 family serine peptidase [Steroidobacteraceae bacterium]
MKRLSFVKSSICVLAVSLTAIAAPESTPDEAQQLAEGTQSDVIVILRDQIADAPPVRKAMTSRAFAVATSQHSLITELQQGRTRKVHSFSTINAFATSVSAAEAAHLATHPEVMAVVPDLPIRSRRLQSPNRSSNAIPAAIAAAAPSATSSLCNTLEPEALQITNTAFVNPATPQAQEVRDGNGVPVTGKGVKVAYIADGLDPTVAGFTRPDGSNVFIDYQDFTGDPAGTPTGAAEAFGDAASIAAQDMPNGKPLFFDISKFVVPHYPLPSPCNIRIRGMAPGASLVGLNVFSSLGFTSTSTFVQAIEWAVSHDDVDVINESFGGNPFPDTDNDPISLADAAAIKAGVTVVVSTGDAGTAGTLGSPGTDNGVIAVGGTNSWRVYAQTHDGAIPLTPHSGVINNNISALSSGGFAQHNARTVDVVAPGDSGWSLCSSNIDIYFECTDFNNNPSAFQIFGGTSESSPLTAGEAALVIQAYRSTHRGADPSPALVKQIIMSTATDLGAPSFEQGAGLINSLAAVNLALSIDDAHGRPKARGTTVLASPNATTITDMPGSRQVQRYTISNPGTTAVQLAPALESLGQIVAGKTLSLNLDPAKDATFINSGGNARAFIKQTFKVPAGVQHLDAAIAFQIDLTSTDSPLVLFALLDPSGNQAAYSLPQGTGNGYGHVDVVSPAAGTWTVIVWTRPVGAAGSYSGPVQFTWSAENYTKLGSVSPAKLTLAPGQSQTLTANFFMPSEPGDLGAAIRLHPSGGAQMPQIPVSLRTIIPTTSTGANFTGTLTGGNGRNGAGPTQTFVFDVPQNVSNMSLTLDISDPGYILEGVLVDPNGMELSVQPNLDPAGNPVFALQMYKNNPQAGQWQFVLLLNFFSSGNQTSLPFTARIGFNGARIVSTGVPQSKSVMISASRTTMATVEVVNTGAVTTAYFADPRLTALGVTSLPAVQNPTCGVSATLPGTCGQFVLPPETSAIQFTAQSTAPINMDAFNDVGFLDGVTGAPDIFAKKTGPNTVVASLTAPVIPWGTWNVVPALIGPFSSVGALTKPVTMAALATMKKFDTTMAANSGDLWADATLGTNTFNPLVLGSGEVGTITLKIKPSASQVGKSVTGFIYIDTFNPVVGTGDEVVRIPYAYTVVK